MTCFRKFVINVVRQQRRQCLKCYMPVQKEHSLSKHKRVLIYSTARLRGPLLCDVRLSLLRCQSVFFLGHGKIQRLKTNVHNHEISARWHTANKTEFLLLMCSVYLTWYVSFISELPSSRWHYCLCRTKREDYCLWKGLTMGWKKW